MQLAYLLFDSIPPDNISAGIINVHVKIFGEAEGLAAKMKRKPHLIVLAAMEEEKVVGYKIGYEKDKTTFYSWLGVVDAEYRNQGIASGLMKKSTLI